MARVNKPMEGDATYWGKIIEDAITHSSNRLCPMSSQSNAQELSEFCVWIYGMLWRQEEIKYMAI